MDDYPEQKEETIRNFTLFTIDKKRIYRIGEHYRNQARVITYEKPIDEWYLNNPNWKTSKKFRNWGIKLAENGNKYLRLDHSRWYKSTDGTRIHIFSNYHMSQEDIDHAIKNGYTVIPPMYAPHATSMMKAITPI
jgi:hypothetical protein